MTFVTKLTLRSGDRAALDGVVSEIKETCHRKGAELKGPHSDSPEQHRLRQYTRLDGDDDAQFDPWNYTVYRRRMELYGHDDLARLILERSFPSSVHVEAELERVRTVGSA
jgi:ribosomal protein S10